MKTRAGKAFLPIPSRSWIYPTSAYLKCRTRVNPSSDAGRGRPARLTASLWGANRGLPRPGCGTT